MWRQPHLYRADATLVYGLRVRSAHEAVLWKAALPFHKRQVIACVGHQFLRVGLIVAVVYYEVLPSLLDSDATSWSP